METKVKLYYFTDPLCSHCWALDFSLNRFKMEYKEHLDVITVMGGMIEDGNHFTDLHGKEATEQAEHWQQVGLFYRVPVDKDIWHKNPITSSFPSSIAYLLIREKHPHLATKFLRLVREGAFAFQRNIADKDVLTELVESLGIEPSEIIKTSFAPSGKKLLEENYRPILELGVTGFPTVIMVNDKNEGIKVTGARNYDTYKKAFAKLTGTEENLDGIKTPTLLEFLKELPTMFYVDIAKTYDLKEDQIDAFIKKELSNVGYVTGFVGKYKYVQLNNAN